MPSIISATTTTGLVTNADNSGSLQLATNNGTTAVTIDTAQNVGIGTSSPASKLDIVGSTTGAVQQFIKNSNGATNSSADLVFGNWSGSTPAAPQAKISAINAASSDARTDLAFSTYTGLALTERMRIDSAGNLLVGTTTQLYGERLNVTRGGVGNNAATFYFDTSDDRGVIVVRHAGASGATSRTQIAFLDSGGTERGRISSNGSATSYVTSSDYRLKENIAPMTGALGVVQQLKPVTYKWKTDGSAGQGFIAHELQAVVPDCVVGEKDAVDADGKPVYQGIDTSFLVATLTAAIQELKAELDATKAEVQALKGAR
jgi:hypothetical protein